MGLPGDWRTEVSERICSGVVAGLVALVVLASAGCEPDSDRVHFMQHPILGGTEVPEGEYMEVVLLVANAGGYQYNCTGTLISRRVVMTAAHCLDLDNFGPENLSVRFGRSQADSVRVRVDDFMIHPDWDSDRLRQDIALIRLADDPPAGATPVPQLPDSLALTADDVGAEVTFVGFGINDLGLQATKIMMTTTLTTVCTRLYGCHFAQQNTICIDQEPTGICSGDSGGPVFIERQGVRYVAGVNSYTGSDPETGQGCLWFGCSTKVDAFQDFIDDYVGDPDGSACDVDLDCASGSCSDGVCCSQDCDGSCQVCDLPGQEGTCQTLPDQTPCPDPNACNGQEVCLNGSCELTEPLQCADEVACTKDLCDPNTGCVFQPSALACFDDNECTQEQCDAELGCLYNDLPDGSPCGLKGQCQAGLCVEKTGGSGCGCTAAGRPAPAGLLVLLAWLIGVRRRARARRFF